MIRKNGGFVNFQMAIHRRRLDKYGGFIIIKKQFCIIRRVSDFMRQRSLYIFYYLKHLHHRARAKFTHSYNALSAPFLGKRPPSDEEANALIKRYLTSNEPFALCRLGSAEFTLVQLYDEYRLFHSNRLPQSNMYDIFHRNPDEVGAWVELLRKDCKDIDVMAYFDDHPIEEYVIRTSCRREMEQIRLEQIEAMLYEEPWTLALEGKKVLLISPFVDSMVAQYPCIDKIYEGRKMLPAMELKTLKSVWFSGSPEDDFETWFDALNYLYEEAMKIDFDVALLSCSAFGFNLAPMFKRAGKQAIQYGGALQMLFGIRGARWDNYPPYMKFYNNYWIRPPKDTTPSKGFVKKMDDGCYW